MKASVSHQFYNTDRFFPTWEVKYLFLGTFNPEGGESLDYYYRRQRNGFWKIIKTLFDPNNEYTLATYEELHAFMVAKGIGCVDVIKKVTFPEDMKEKICGKGYEDQKLFTVTDFSREYTFDEIKQLLIQKKIFKVFSTWGKRKGPAEFRDKLLDFVSFCNVNDICYTPLPSPSGRLYKGIRKQFIIDEWGQKINKKDV